MGRPVDRARPLTVSADFGQFLTARYELESIEDLSRALGRDG